MAIGSRGSVEKRTARLEFEPFEGLVAKKITRVELGFVAHFRARMDVVAHVVVLEIGGDAVELLCLMDLSRIKRKLEKIFTDTYLRAV